MPTVNNPVDRSLQKTGTSSATVLYRDGVDVVDASAKNGKIPIADDARLKTTSTFGLILSTLIPNVLASHSFFAWSHWEQDAGKVRAVFRYEVPENVSLYGIAICCLPDGDRTSVFKKQPGYHGEISIDPVSGAILRMTVEAELQPDLPIIESKIMVDYSPTEIGGKTYICPSRSIFLARGRSVRSYNNFLGGHSWLYGPYNSMLNDVAYENYHIFRAESRILTGDEPAPDRQRDNPASTGVPAIEPKPNP